MKIWGSSSGRKCPIYIHDVDQQDLPNHDDPPLNGQIAFFIAVWCWPSCNSQDTKIKIFSIQLIQQWILAIIDGDIYSEAEGKNGDSNDDLNPPSWSCFSLPNLTKTQTEWNTPLCGKYFWWGTFGGYPKIRQTVFDPFPKVYDKYHVWVDDAGDYSLGKEFLTWMDERIVDERHWPIIARTGSET